MKIGRRPRHIELKLPPIITVSAGSSVDGDTGESEDFEPSSARSSSAPSSPCAGFNVWETQSDIPPAPLSERSLGLMKRGSSKGSASGGFGGSSFLGSFRTNDTLSPFEDDDALGAVSAPEKAEAEEKAARQTVYQRLGAFIVVCMLVILLTVSVTSTGGPRSSLHPPSMRRPHLRSVSSQPVMDTVSAPKSVVQGDSKSSSKYMYGGFGLALVFMFAIRRRSRGGRYMHVVLDADMFDAAATRDTSLKTPTAAQRAWAQELSLTDSSGGL